MGEKKKMENEICDFWIAVHSNAAVDCTNVHELTNIKHKRVKGDFVKF